LPSQPSTFANYGRIKETLTPFSFAFQDPQPCEDRSCNVKDSGTPRETLGTTHWGAQGTPHNWAPGVVNWDVDASPQLALAAHLRSRIRRDDGGRFPITICCLGGRHTWARLR
jgi:hypothetical protein